MNKRFLLALCLMLGLGYGALAQDLMFYAPAASQEPVKTLDGSEEGVRRPSGRWCYGLGGGLGFSSSTGWDIRISPGVSYQFNNSFFVGAQVSYSYFQHESLGGVCPYARWHIVPLGKAVSVYATAYAPFQFGRDYLHIGARLKPGIGIRLQPGTYLLLGFGSVGYSSFREGGLNTSGWVSDWGPNTIDVGIYLDF